MSDPTKTVVVTGASRGIGAAITRTLAREGFRVLALARSRPALEALAAEARAQGWSEVVPHDFDAADPTGVEALGARLAAQAPWALVNNAGIALSAPIHKTSPDELSRLMQVNLHAPFVLSRALSPGMVRAGGGRIVNIASTAGLKGFRYTSAYCASKHALVGMTRALAMELGPKNVTVNAICPGWTDTDMLAASVQSITRATGRSADEARATLAGMNAMGKLIDPGDVAALCAFLLSPKAGTVNGATWTMDGGEAA